MQRQDRQFLVNVTDVRTIPSAASAQTNKMTTRQLIPLPVTGHEILFNIPRNGAGGFKSPCTIHHPTQNLIAGPFIQPRLSHVPSMQLARLGPSMPGIASPYGYYGPMSYCVPQPIPMAQLAVGQSPPVMSQEFVPFAQHSDLSERLQATTAPSHPIAKSSGPSNTEGDENDVFKDEILPIISTSPEKVDACKALAKYTSSKYRYLYKCIVRNLHSFIRKNREDIVETLKKACFGTSEIEHAFFMVGCHSDVVSKRSCDKTSLMLVNNMLATKSIYTHILRETLHGMLLNWDTGDMGRISKKNIEMYAESCKAIYEEVCRILGQPAQGKTFVL